MRPFLAALVVSAALAPCASAADLRYFDDAPLHAVQFVDPKVGWAAGDDGVVWHTIDGGATWERQPTGTRASLRSLFFFDALAGWVVGREELPHGGGSVGVLLYTRDGGETWHQLLPNALPGLNAVTFGDQKTGYLLGDANDHYATGVLQTKDGGRSWQPVPGPRVAGWLAGSFRDGDTGVLAGPWGRLASVRPEGFGKCEYDPLGGRCLRGIQMREQHTFAVGQGAALLHSGSAGAGYGFVDHKLPADVQAAWDFHAVHGVGDHVWVAGRPGSVLLHSAQRGGKGTWKAVKTGQPVPLNGVHFFDEKRGWAVGEFGTILATEDGGQKWTVQRRGGQRAAVLVVQARGGDCPVDALASLGGEDGYLIAALRVTSSDPASAPLLRAMESQRYSAAVRKAGGAAGELLWQFPVPQHLEHADKQEVLKYWNELHGGAAAHQLVRQLVLALRLWQPSVVVVDHPDAKAGGNAAGALVAEALHEAFAQAADPKAFPEQMEALGLTPWAVSKVYALWDKKQDAQVVLDGNADLPRLETSPREFAAPALALLADQPALLPAERWFRLVDNRVDGGAKMGQLLAGAPDLKTGVCRRELPALAELAPEVVKANKVCRQLKALAETPGVTAGDAERMLAQLAPALKGLPAEQGAAALSAVAGQYAQRGQWLLAREAFQLLADRYPNSPRTLDAYRWLVRHNASSEARRRHELGQFHLELNTDFKKVMPGEVLPAVMKGEDGKVDPLSMPKVNEQVHQAKGTFLSNPAESGQWYRGSLDIAKRLHQFGPLFATDAPLQFCVQAARRQLGEHKEAQQWYAEYRTHQKDGPWRDAAAQELWLLNRSGPPPRAVAVCRKTAQRPYLDGHFDDPCWQGMQPLALKNAVRATEKEYQTEAMLAYDKEFLYLAVRCKHPKGQQVPPVKVRQRDADLRGFDRVSLLLDLDRDYATCFHLQIDQRGCVCEDCWGDRTWNPQWFVAVRSEETHWQVEAAIPMSQLTGHPVTVATAWACNVVRVLPGRGVQALATPADVEPRPEGLGLLLFNENAPPAAPVPKQAPLSP